MTATTSSFKRGDTFLLACKYKEDGIAKAITTETFRAQIRDAYAGSLVADLVCTIDSDQVANKGKFYLSLSDPTETKNWAAPATLVTDIEISNGGVVISTENILIPVDIDQTV